MATVLDSNTRLDGDKPKDNSAARAERLVSIERAGRLWSGVILFIYALTHFLGHAVGIFGVDAMEALQTYQRLLWRTWPGTVLLYGSAALHILLVSKRIVSRRTWRMPVQEALQIVLGLAIPILLYEHIVGTRVVSSFADVDSRYASTLQLLYPEHAIKQTILLLVVWIHGVIGLHYTLRARSWFPRWREVLLVIAVLIPVLSLAGFVSGAREALEFDIAEARWTDAQRATFIEASRLINLGLLAFAGLMVASVVGLAITRRLGQRIGIRYVGHGIVDLPKGSTLLEGSRNSAIPHPSLCGGRGRCSTCRVLVTEGAETLQAPNDIEAQMLKRIQAPPRVRLACQIRPKKPISVQVLLPVDVSEGNVDWGEEAYKWGTEREATVLFVDLRAFTRLSQTQLPYDLIVMLNRFLSEMRQACEAHGGRVTNVVSDGLTAVFGLQNERRAGASQAIGAARAMLKSVDALNTEWSAALTIPLRIGVGIHTGPVVMARVGDDVHGYAVSALGETVTIASKLEQATKDALTDCLISQETIKATGRPAMGASRRELSIPGREKPVFAYPLIAATDAKGSETTSDTAETEEELVD
ncbi:MAG: adenylate/guanylate cyclase domain-containing protein [Pseudomonadota bacterium]